MTHRRICQYSILAGLWLASATPVLSQTDDTCESFLNVTRSSTGISASDQRTIGLCVEAQVRELAGAKADKRSEALQTFRAFFKHEYRHAQSSAQFKEELVKQTLQVANTQYTAANTPPVVRQALAHVLADFESLSAHAGHLAGLASKQQVVRYHAAKALTALKPQIAADRTLLNSTIAALQAAGVAETNGVVLRRIYMALAYEGEVTTVVDAYLAILDKRIETRRTGANMADMAEVEVWEYLRLPTVNAALDQNAKQQIVKRVAVMLRLDATRYAASGQTTSELDTLERRLDGEEWILASLVGQGEGTVRDTLGKTGRTDRNAIVQEAVKWFGDAETGTTGLLNQAPWSVPVGAP